MRGCSVSAATNTCGYVVRPAITAAEVCKFNDVAWSGLSICHVGPRENWTIYVNTNAADGHRYLFQQPPDCVQRIGHSSFDRSIARPAFNNLLGMFTIGAA